MSCTFDLRWKLILGMEDDKVAYSLIIEVHPNIAEPWSVGAQQIGFDGFKQLIGDFKSFVAAAGRK